MKAPRGKPVVIEGLEFHTCGKGLVHIFPQHVMKDLQQQKKQEKAGS